MDGWVNEAAIAVFAVTARARVARRAVAHLGGHGRLAECPIVGENPDRRLARPFRLSAALA